MKKLLVILFLFSSAVFGADPIYTPWHNNIAIKGYDTVAYFTEHAAVKGEQAYSTQWQGATWHFSSDKHLALFSANPQKYAPQYGGYCAYAVASNKLVGIDPQQFTVFNNKLYLNYSHSVQQKWLPEKQAFITRADENWLTILND